MKFLLRSLLLVLVLSSRLAAQGTINFSNRDVTDGIDAPVTDTDGKTRLSGVGFLAQLYAGLTPTTIAPVGPPQTFRTGAAAGYMDLQDPLRIVNSVTPGSVAVVQMRVWVAADGASYEAAQAKGGKTGASVVLNITTGGRGNPPSLPANLKGLKPFSLVLGTPPQITQQPTPLSVSAGQPAAFTVKASGTQPLSFTWSKDGTDLPGNNSATLSIPSVQLSDAGRYSVTVSNGAGKVTSTAVALTVNSAPQIIAQPESASANPGAAIIFTVNAAGSGTLSYQWMFNGSAISGATAKTLALNNVQTAQEGTYWVVVKNTLGQAASDGAVLMLNRPGGTITFSNRDIGSGIDAPIFDSDGVTRLSGTAYLAQLYAGSASDQLSPVGPAVPFRTGVAAGYWLGEPSPVRNLSKINPGQPAFIQIKVWESAKGRSFEESAAAAGKVGSSSKYSLVTGGAGTPPSLPSSLVGLASFKLIQGQAPKITTQPAATTANAGTTATLRVVATGTAPLTYQWRVNNLAIEGATSATLSLPNVKSTDAGSYSVDVSNLFGSVSSTKAVLTVNSAPEIVSQPTGIKASPGSSVTFAVSASGSQPLTYQWRFNGANIVGATSSSLTRSGITAANEGSYSVVISNPVGKTTSESAGLLIVRNGATVLFSNRDLNSGIDAKVLNSDGSPLSGEGFLAQLYAGPTADDLQPVGPAVTFRTGIAAGYWAPDPEPTRFIASVPPGNKAFVQARVWETAKGTSFEKAVAASSLIGVSTLLNVATGGDGNPPQLPGNLIGLTSFKLSPALPPSISKQPTDLTVDASKPAVFEVTAVGTAPLAFQWKKDGTPISGATSARLTITSASPIDAGSYTVDIRNPIQSITSNPAKLTVNAAPRVLSQPEHALVPLGGSVTLTAEVSGSTPLTLQWRFNGTDIPGATTASLRLSNVQPSTEGTYELRVQNALGTALSDPAVVAISRSGGTVLFANRDLSSGIDAPVTDTDGITRLSGPAFLAQLYAGSSASNLSPVGPAVPFRTDAAAGYWSLNPAPDRALPSSAPGSPAMVQARVWEAAKGRSFEEALANKGKIGMSEVLTVTTGGAGSPPSFPASLTGLKPFKLLIGEPPKITTNPVSLIRNEGQSASFSVVASGTEPLKFQWRHAGISIPSATQSSFTIPSVQAANAGAYSVEVSNPVGSVVSLDAILTANTRPAFVTQPESIAVLLNQPATLSAEVQGSQPLTLQWKRNGTAVPGANTLTLSLASVTSANEGTYTLEARNSFGAAVSDPAVVLALQSTHGGTFAFLNRQTAVGIDAPVFDTDGTTRLSGASFLAQPWAGPSASDLKPVGPAVPFRTGAAAGYWNAGPDVSRIIPNVLPGATASIQIRAWSAASGSSFDEALAAGSPVGISDILTLKTGGEGVPPQVPVNLVGLKSFKLTAGTPPTIVSHPSPKPVQIGKIATFTVLASSSSPISYQWLRNNTPIPNATSSRLDVGPAQASDAANYSVRVSNAFGSVVSIPAALIIQQNVLAGVALDGYIAGATVFLDVNRNGLAEATEPSTQTDDQGRFTLAYPLADFDVNKNGKLDAEEGVIVVLGGVDVSTGLPLGAPLQAPADSTVVSPLTTLVQKVADQNPTLGLAAAESAVKSAFAIPQSVDLSTFDPVSAALQNDRSSLAVLGAAAKVQDTIVQAASLLDGASTQKSYAELADSVSDAIAASISTTGGATLSDAKSVHDVIQTAAKSEGIQIDPATSSGAASIIAEGNQLKDEFVQSTGSSSSIATEIARVQGVTQGTTSDKLAETGAGTTSITETVLQTTGAALVETLKTAPVGDLSGTDVRVGTLAFAQSTFQVDESGRTSAAFSIVRTDGNQGEISADITFKDGSARSDSGDYISASIRITFADGEMSKSLDWAKIILEDSAVEAKESFTISLALAPNAPSAARLGLSSATVEILDNDDVGTFSFASNAAVVSESGSPIKPLVITRTGGSSAQVVLTLTPAEIPNSAKAGSDFLAAPFPVVFASGQTSQTVLIPVIDDRQLEKLESFNLKLSIPTGSSSSAKLGAITTATVDIKDNEFVLSPPRVSRTGQVVVSGVGEPSRSYTLEASTDLIKWSTLSTRSTDAAGSVDFSDSTTSSPWRFYRVRPSL